MSTEFECEQVLLVQADFDGELDAAAAFAINQHRARCDACTRAYETLSKTSDAARKGERFEAPPTLRARVLKHARPRTSYVALWISSALVGAAAAACALLFVGAPWSMTTTDTLIDRHVRAMQTPQHLLDIVSTEHHVVKPWFDGQLSFSPPVKDLAHTGYPLRGGRVDVLNGRSIAVLAYQAGQHTIDLFVWPLGEQPKSASANAERGFNIRRWTTAAMELTAVSDLNERELDDFVARWQMER
jgi:anti-sigma factor RsiW